MDKFKMPECIGCAECCKYNNEVCPHLDITTKTCKIYETRPNICKNFERGGDECLKLISRIIVDKTNNIW